MESQPQNPEFRINLENFHPCTFCSVIPTWSGKSRIYLQIYWLADFLEKYSCNPIRAALVTRSNVNHDI